MHTFFYYYLISKFDIFLKTNPNTQSIYLFPKQNNPRKRLKQGILKGFYSILFLLQQNYCLHMKSVLEHIVRFYVPRTSPPVQGNWSNTHLGGVFSLQENRGLNVLLSPKQIKSILCCTIYYNAHLNLLTMPILFNERQDLPSKGVHLLTKRVRKNKKHRLERCFDSPKQPKSPVLPDFIFFQLY